MISGYNNIHVNPITTQIKVNSGVQFAINQMIPSWNIQAYVNFIALMTCNRLCTNVTAMVINISNCSMHINHILCVGNIDSLQFTRLINRNLTNIFHITGKAIESRNFKSRNFGFLPSVPNSFTRLRIL